MKHFCLKLEILVEFILLYCTNLWEIILWFIQWVCEICIEFDQHVEANGRNLQQITANLQWNTGREVGWAIVIVVRSFLRWTIQQKQQSVQPYLLVLSINAFDRNNHNKFHFQTESQFFLLLLFLCPTSFQRFFCLSYFYLNALASHCFI